MSQGYLTEAETPSRAELDRMTGLVLVEFGTDWCGTCRAMASTVKGLLSAQPAVRHLKVEDGPGRALGRSFRVKLWPYFVLMRDGVVLRELSRPGSTELRQAFETLVAPAGA